MVIFVAVVGVADGEPQPRPVAVVGVAAVVHALVVAAQLLCRLDEAVGTCGDLRLQRHHPPCDVVHPVRAAIIKGMNLAYVCLANEAASDRGILEPRLRLRLTNVAHPLRHWLWFFRFIAVFDHILIDRWRGHGVGNATHNTELQRGAAGQSGVGWLRGRR